MDISTFIYNLILRGYEIIGFDKKKAERIALLQKNKQKFNDFTKSLDLMPIVRYFEFGLEAQVFTDNMTGKVLQKNHNLFWGFNHAGYQYLLSRRPIPQTRNPLQNILNEARREKLNNMNKSLPPQFNLNMLKHTPTFKKKKTKVEGEVFPSDNR